MMLIRVKLAFEYFQIARRSIQPICPSWQRVLNLFEVAAVRSIYHIVPIRNRTRSTFGSASDYIEWLSETIRCVLKLIGICFFDAEFKIVQFEGLNPVLEFLALRGRSYSVIGSDDLVTWVPVSFQVQSALASGSVSLYQSSQLKQVRVTVPADFGTAPPKFFKLLVN